MEKKAIFEAVRAIIANDFAPRFAAQSQQPVIERDTRLWADLNLDNQDIKDICNTMSTRYSSLIYPSLDAAEATVGQLVDCIAYQL